MQIAAFCCGAGQEEPMLPSWVERLVELYTIPFLTGVLDYDFGPFVPPLKAIGGGTYPE